ncbi:MAG: fibronectin type III domain-containing protein, partial [Fuerstiella sp.]
SVTTEWSPGLEFEIGGRPVVVNPASTTDTTPTLSWLPVESAAGYEVYFAASDDVPNPILNESGLNATSITLTEELTPGNYKFWVRAIAADGTLTPWSLNSQSMLTVRAVAVPVLNDVPDGSDSTPTISWSSVSGAARYEIFISLRATPTVPVLRLNNLTDTSFTPATPLALGDYRVWVRSISTNSEVSDWSVPDSFTIASNEPENEDRRSAVQLVSLDAAATTWQPEDVTVSQLYAGVVSESERAVDETARQLAGTATAEPLPAANVSDSSAQQLEELQSGDVLMAAWDDAIWKEESEATPTAEHNDPSAESKQTAATGWLAGLAAFSPALFRKRRKKRK